MFPLYRLRVYASGVWNHEVRASDVGKIVGTCQAAQKKAYAGLYVPEA